MEIRKIFADLNDTLTVSPYGNPDVAVVRDLNKEFPGIFRYAVDKLLVRGSWEDRVMEAFKSLSIFGVPEDRYYSAAERVVEKIEVPEPVKRTFEKVSNTVNGVIVFTACTQYISKSIVEEKLEPLLDAEFIIFGTKLGVDKHGLFTRIKRIYGYADRAKIAKELKNGEVSLNIADNHSNVNQGMIREGTYGALLSNWNSCDREGNIFYARPKHLPVVVDQILKEEKSIQRDYRINLPPVCVKV